MNKSRYNLMDDPWCEVVTAGGAIERVSILEAFDRADELRGLGQDLSTQRFAVLRVLLAILHRACAGPTATDWAQAWRSGLPMDRITAYADSVRDRFWLVDPSAPFFQTPTLMTAKGPEPGLRKIIADFPDGQRLFSNRTERDVERVPWPEAATWLIHAQAYDTAGIKTGAIGDALVKSGKGYGYGLPAWAGQIGGLSAIGSTLRETLLLNLIADTYDVDDLPAWERPVPTAWRGNDPEYERLVTGRVDLMTWQSRRILLGWDEGSAVSLSLCQGDRITPQDPPLHNQEPMTAWRYSKPQSDKYGHTIFMPQQHDPSRQAWRGVSRLLGLPQPERATSSKAAPEATPTSLLVAWLEKLSARFDLPGVQLELAGYEYGGQNATYDDVVDDSMGIPAVLLDSSEGRAAWGAAVSQAVTQASEVAYAVRRFAENLNLASGQDRPETPQWQERCFAALDAPLRSWLAHLAPDGDLTHAKTSWQQSCRTVAWDLADELLRGLGPPAFEARAPHDDNSPPMTPARAEIYFRAALRKALPLTVSPTPQEES
ncbi:MAG: type I-E CRISPR-associated protein Cse1/CasA [Nostocoides sp.]